MKVECHIQHEIIVSDKVKDGNESQEVHCSTSSSVSNVESVNKDIEDVNEIDDLVISSRAMPDKDEDKVTEGMDLKHLISVEVRISLYVNLSCS